MQSESLMLYKLIILYILDRMTFPITNTELTRFILEKEYASYLTIQETLEEHMISPVRFSKCLETMMNSGIDTFPADDVFEFVRVRFSFS